MEDIKEKWDTVAMVGVAIIWTIKQIVNWVKEKKSKIPLTDSNNDLDKQIYSILHTLRNRYRCSRIYIQQFHNGQKAYSGQSLQRKTITHEVVDDKVERLKPFYDGRLISDHTHRILSILRTYGEYYVPDVEELKSVQPKDEHADDVMEDNNDLYEWCMENGVRSFYCVRIVDIKQDVTIATLNLHFTITDGLYHKSYRNDVKKYRRQLESLFDKV